MTERTAPDALLFPASAGQQRLWFLDRMTEAAGRAYTLAVRLDLTGELDRAALQAALTAVADRHEALRTGLRDVDGELRQVVVPGATVPLPVATVAEADLDDVLRTEAQRTWNLAQAPLVRALLVRRAPDRHVLLLCAHHSVCDGLSLQVMLRELVEFYTAGRFADPEPPLQFADYVVWASGAERAERRTTAAAFWADALRGAPYVLEVPGDRRRPPVQSYTGGRVPVAFDAAYANRLRDWSTAHGVTLFATLLAAYAVVLSRTSGNDDLLIGLPVGNRGHADLAGTVGYLANTCPVRADLRDGPDTAALARRMHDTLAGVLDHADLPFGELVDRLSPPRMPERNPVFQVMFGLQQDVRRHHETAGLTVDVSDVDVASARVDLSLFLFEETGGPIDGFLEYADAIYDPATADRLAAHLRAVLDHLLADGTVPVAEVPLGAAGTRFDGGPLALEWETVLPRIAETAARVPDAVAVNDLTYAGLRTAVAAAAGALRAQGVTAGDRVAVRIERGTDAVTTMLACWQLGAVYVPVDGSAPEPRRAMILEQAAPRTTVTGPLSGGEPVTEPVAVDPDATAYLMFTSGSTGRPKGVAVSHRNLAYFLQAIGRRVAITGADRLLALTTTAFDISLLELLAPLTVGGSVEVAPASTPKDAGELAARLGGDGITVAQATPAVWRLALAGGWRPRPAFRVLCGGEALPGDLADALARTGATVHNLYGPTETTIWSCSAAVRPGAPVVLGTPLPGTTAAVVDAALHPVPAGICGELLIGGPGVSLGYLDDPQQTAARFPEIGGERFYRTGDLVRRRPDGDLEFLGRADDQVKVRGNRIELGEVEAALRGLDGVTDAAAAVLGSPPRIAAFLVTGGDPQPAKLRAALAAVLPAGMLPTEFHVRDAIPLNANGKVDRRALPDGARRLRGGAERTAPRTPAEVAVAAVWRDLLDVGEVGVDENFFELGGHSLLAAHLLQRLENELGARVPVAEFFVEPTVARIAETVTQLRGRPEPEAAPEPEPADDDWDFPAVHRATVPNRDRQEV